jgi:hypothetical protein
MEYIIKYLGACAFAAALLRNSNSSCAKARAGQTYKYPKISAINLTIVKYSDIYNTIIPFFYNNPPLLLSYGFFFYSYSCLLPLSLVFDILRPANVRVL